MTTLSYLSLVVALTLEQRVCVLWLQSCRTTKEMANEFLLQMLRKRGPTAFQRFLKCLVQADDNLHHVAARLDPGAPARYAVT